MNSKTLKWRIVTALLFANLASGADEPKTNAISGIKGVPQEALESVKKIETPTIVPTVVRTAQGADRVDGVDPVKGVTQPGPVVPPVTPVGHPEKGVNQVEGIKAKALNAVKPVATPSSGVVSTIRTVEGVQGIITQKQKNLEAALLMKEDHGGTSAIAAKGGKGAAAAALLPGPPGLIPPAPAPKGDGRDTLQQFEKLTTPGS